MRILFVGFDYCPCIANAQLDFVFIDSISVQGNKKTKESIILREMLVGRRYSSPAELSALMDRSEELIMNTGMFNQAEISFQNLGRFNQQNSPVGSCRRNLVSLPGSIFELADRNFNVWWVEQGAPNASTLGWSLPTSIFRQKDRLKISAKYGYTRKYALSYNPPFSIKHRRWACRRKWLPYATGDQLTPPMAINRSSSGTERSLSSINVSVPTWL